MGSFILKWGCLSGFDVDYVRWSYTFGGPVLIRSIGLEVRGVELTPYNLFDIK
jgi:hypothetical protein